MKTMRQLLLHANACYLWIATSRLLAEALGILLANGPQRRLIAAARTGALLWSSLRTLWIPRQVVFQVDAATTLINLMGRKVSQRIRPSPYAAPIGRFSRSVATS
jgi:hypothetical protein